MPKGARAKDSEKDTVLARVPAPARATNKVQIDRATGVEILIQMMAAGECSKRAVLTEVTKEFGITERAAVDWIHDAYVITKRTVSQHEAAARYLLALDSLAEAISLLKEAGDYRGMVVAADKLADRSALMMTAQRAVLPDDAFIGPDGRPLRNLSHAELVAEARRVIATIDTQGESSD